MHSKMPHQKAPVIFPGYKGGDPSTPFSVRLPDIISEEQFAAECEALFRRDKKIHNITRQKERHKINQVKESLRVDKNIAFVKEKLVIARKEKRRATARVNYLRARIQFYMSKKAYDWKPFTNLDYQIRQRKIEIVRKHAGEQWSKARDEFTRNWDKRSASKFLNTTILKLDETIPIEDLMTDQFIKNPIPPKES